MDYHSNVALRNVDESVEAPGRGKAESIVVGWSRCQGKPGLAFKLDRRLPTNKAVRGPRGRVLTSHQHPASTSRSDSAEWPHRERTARANLLWVAVCRSGYCERNLRSPFFSPRRSEISIRPVDRQIQTMCRHRRVRRFPKSKQEIVGLRVVVLATRAFHHRWHGGSCRSRQASVHQGVRPTARRMRLD